MFNAFASQMSFSIPSIMSSCLKVAESHCQFRKPVKNRKPLLDREVLIAQVLLFKPPDFVWVLDHRITVEVFC